MLNTIVGILRDGKPVEASVNEFPRNDPWPEVWTVNACGTKYLVPMQNTPKTDGISTHLNVKDFIQQ